MTAQKKNQEINLLPPKGFATTTSGRVLTWILSTFRIIVIVTEIVVMCAFLSRFWLDTQITDLNEDIERKTTIISASSKFENDFRDSQRRLDIFKQLTKNEKMLQNSLQAVVGHLPPDVSLRSFTYQGYVSEIEGKSASERSIQQFMVNLNSSNLFTRIGLVDLQEDTENSSLLTFRIRLALPEGENQ